MSGGGFRAAAFSLGAIAYLNQLKSGDTSLLERVKFIGSTSGGSIANLAYAAGICSGTSFHEIYHLLLETLEGERVITKAFELLDNDGIWKNHPEKSRNLINAFSMAYNELIFPGQHLDILNSELKSTHIEEICVNSTELANGLSFRFQSQHPDESISKGKIGNSYIHFKTGTSEIFGKVRLSDMLAASSCFPGGFEPMLFPEDFTHAQLDAKTLTGAINYRENPFSTRDNPEDLFKDKDFKSNPKRFGLLDGGIADNQATDSILLANQRRVENKREPFDMILICDVTSYLMDAFTLPMQKKTFLNNFSVRFIQRFLFLLAGLFPITILGLVFYGWKPNLTLVLLPLLAAFSINLYSRFQAKAAKENVHQTKSTWGIIFFRYVKYFLKLRLGLISQMIEARLKSVFMITSDVYLRQIRAHYYSKLFSDDKFRNIVVTNAIYDLSLVKQNARNREEHSEKENGNTLAGRESLSGKTVLESSNKIIQVAEKARLVATTLWFDEHSRGNDEKAAVVATGQFTLCYNLIKHLIKVRERALLVPSVTEPVQNDSSKQVFDQDTTLLLEMLLKDWERFNEDPFWLYKQSFK